MNNKGFAVTTILYGIMVLFCLLLVSLLGILSSYRKTQELLINENNGARSILKGYSEQNMDDNSCSLDSEGNSICSLTFDCNGGNFEGGSLHSYTYTYRPGELVDLYLQCSKAGKNTLRWRTPEGNVVADGDDYVMPNKNITLFAVWD